jgi:hypothetical protein
MRHLGLAALAIALLPTVALANGRNHFGAFFGFGDGFGFGFGNRYSYVDFGLPVGCAAYPQYGYAVPVYAPPAVVVSSAPVYYPPPVVYVAPPPPVVYYTPRYYSPGGYYYIARSRYYPR